MLTMLGIPNCNTVKKARIFLETHHVPFVFRDVRKEPLSREEWLVLLDDDHEVRLINTRSPSFRNTGLKASDLTSKAVKADLLLGQPTAMKRPVMLRQGKLVIIGFSEQSFTDSVGEE